MADYPKWVTLTQADVDACFEGKDNQEDVIIALYKLIYPDWDDIAKIEGWTAAGHDLNHYIMLKFQVFDQLHHPKVLPGGAWMNNGWSTDRGIPEWVVERNPVVYKEKKA